MAKSTIDIMAFGQLLIGIWILILLTTTGQGVFIFGKIVGIIGALILIITQSMFLWNKWRK